MAAITKGIICFSVIMIVFNSVIVFIDFFLQVFDREAHELLHLFN